MSAKVHLHMHVSDLSKSRDFYEKFLGGDAVKVKQGYVKFLPEWAPVNLALSTGGPIWRSDDRPRRCSGRFRRDGDVAAGPREGRPSGDGRDGVNCCHANQDKFWVKDPDGVEWEVYYLNYDLEGDEAEVRAKPSLALVGGSACCGGNAICSS